MLRHLKAALKTLLPEQAVEKYRKWEQEQALTELGRAVLKADRGPLPGDPGKPVEVAIANMDWLLRAQACSKSQDGGVARDFDLRTGWAPSYPETTGYIIPTLLDGAVRFGRDDYREAARRMLDWLKAIQLPSGGFQGGRIDQTPVVPVTFNTGQILIGLAAGVATFGADAYGEAMHGAACFLRDSLDPDGCWRSHPTPFAAPGDKAYETHVAWGLFEAERVAPGEGYGEAGQRQVRWAISRQLGNGWFQDNCLVRPDAPLTHTIGYVLRGCIEAYRLTPDTAVLAACRRTADALVGCVRPDGWLAGRYDRDWQPAVDYVCLTGSSQIAACFLLLDAIESNPGYVAAAQRLNQYVRRTISLDGPPDIRGGVKGSHPVDGDYGDYQYLNWAAKFTADAQLMEADRR